MSFKKGVASNRLVALGKGSGNPLARSDRLRQADLIHASRPIAASLRGQLLDHLPALKTASITFGVPDAVAEVSVDAETGGHHHAPEPFHFVGKLAEGSLAIVNPPQGERFRMRLARPVELLAATVSIKRPQGVRETLLLAPVAGTET